MTQVIRLHEADIEPKHSVRDLYAAFKTISSGFPERCGFRQRTRGRNDREIRESRELCHEIIGNAICEAGTALGPGEIDKRMDLQDWPTVPR